MDPSVIKAMAAFVFMGILKDLLVGYGIYKLYKNAGKDLFGNTVQTGSC